MKPLNKKLIPYSKAFKQVSKVIGKEEAFKQLELVWECPECFGVNFKKGEKIELSYSLIGLFTWENSPQGHDFWSDIHYKFQLKDD